MSEPTGMPVGNKPAFANEVFPFSLFNEEQARRNHGQSLRREAIYCPKDGTEFDAIEAGNTGIHRCHYSGEWPSGHWWIAEAGDLWPSRPILYRIAQTHPGNMGKGE